MAQQKVNVKQIVEDIESLSVSELIELQKMFQEKWNISDNDLAGSVAAPQVQASEVEEEEATYNLVASGMKDPTKKIKCTIFLKNTFKLDMQKCKEILENLGNKPVIQPNVSKEDAEKFIKEASSDDIQLILERVKV